MEDCIRAGGRVRGTTCILPSLPSTPYPSMAQLKIELKCVGRSRLWVAYHDQAGRPVVMGPVETASTVDVANGRVTRERLVLHELRTRRGEPLLASTTQPVGVYLEAEVGGRTLSFRGGILAPGGPSRSGRAVGFVPLTVDNPRGASSESAKIDGVTFYARRGSAVPNYIVTGCLWR